MDVEKKENRKIEIDLLRIVACFSVIMLHSSAQYWYELPVSSLRWSVSNGYDALFRFGVPIFVMISGMLFLGREGEVKIKKLYGNNILRLATCYVFWSCIYGLWDCRGWLGSLEVGWKTYVTEMILGRYHLWFVPMLIGIYMLLPVIKVFTDHCSKGQMEYFLLLFVIFQIGRGTLAILTIPKVAQVLVDLVNVEMACSYVGYFILGYYLVKYPPSLKAEKMLYLGGILSLPLAVLISNITSLRAGEPRAEAFDSYSIFTFLVTAAIFVLFTKRLSKRKWKERIARWIQAVSADTFGIYLVHVGLLELLQTKGIDSMTVDSVIGIPLLSVVTFLIGMVITAVLRRIPLLGRYLC